MSGAQTEKRGPGRPSKEELAQRAAKLAAAEKPEPAPQEPAAPPVEPKKEEQPAPPLPMAPAPAPDEVPAPALKTAPDGFVLLPGKWARRKISSVIWLYACFDPEAPLAPESRQFYTQERKRTDWHLQVTLEDGQVLDVKNAIPARVESVKNCWLARSVFWYKRPTVGAKV